MKYLKNKKSNWLLFLGIAVLFLLIVLLQLFGYEAIVYGSSRGSFIDISFWVYCLMAVIIAPLFEEFSFRGNFISNKWKFASLALLLPYIFLSNMSWYILVPLTIIYLVCFFFQHKNFSQKKLFVLYSINAMLFTLIHYELSDFKSLSVVLMFSQLGGAFLLLWIFLNFGFWKSVLFHATFNLIFVFSSALDAFQVDQSKKEYSHNNFKIELSEVPFNFEKRDFYGDEESISCLNCNYVDLIKQFNIDVKELDGYIIKNQFKKVNIVISSKSANIIDDLYGDDAKILKLFEKSGLIKNKSEFNL